MDAAVDEGVYYDENGDFHDHRTRKEILRVACNASALKHVEGLAGALESIRNMLSYYGLDNLDETKIPYSVAEHLIYATDRADQALAELPKELGGAS